MTTVLRPYQAQAVDSVFRELEANRSTLLVAATGTGKTTIFSEVARRWRGRVLVLAHRAELVAQAAGRLGRDLGERVGIDQAQNRSTFERVVVGSVQTIYQPRRLERLRMFSAPTLIIADEAHHAPAKSWRNVLDAFPQAKILGVTATPDRGDGRAMQVVFDTVAFEYGMPEAQRDGWLVPLRGQSVVLGDVDLDAVRTTAGDLAAGQLDEAMLAGGEGVVQGILRAAPDLQGIVFCPGVKTAQFVADRLNELKPGSAASVDGKTDPEVRAATIDRFRDGDLQWLCNCMVFTEGTDLPSAQMIAVARPTKSRALYAQMVGRGTRTLAGTVDGLETAEERRSAIAASSKTHCLILDFVGAGTKHSLATPEDILGGDYSTEERERAKKDRDAGELGDEASVDDYLANARAKIQAAARAMKARVDLSIHKFDPMRSLGVDRDVEEKRLAIGRQPVTEGQRRALLGMGVPEADVRRLTRAGATKVLDTMARRRKEGLATVKQMRLLSKHGVAAADSVTFAGARRAIDYLAATGWGRNTNKTKLAELAGGAGQ